MKVSLPHGPEGKESMTAIHENRVGEQRGEERTDRRNQLSKERLNLKILQRPF